MIFFFLCGHAISTLRTRTRTHTHCTHRRTKLLEACSAGDTSGRRMPTPNWASSRRDLHCFDRRAEDQGRLSEPEVLPSCCPAASQTARRRELARPLAFFFSSPPRGSALSEAAGSLSGADLGGQSASLSVFYMFFLYFTHVLEAAEGLNAAEFSESAVIRRPDELRLLSLLALGFGRIRESQQR